MKISVKKIEKHKKGYFNEYFVGFITTNSLNSLAKYF